MATQLEKELVRTWRRMRSGTREAAGRVLASGGREVSRGRYYEDGPVVVSVSVPKGSWTVDGREIETVEYREDEEAEVMAWRDAVLQGRK